MILILTCKMLVSQKGVCRPTYERVFAYRCATSLTTSTTTTKTNKTKPNTTNQTERVGVGVGLVLLPVLLMGKDD